MRSRLFTPLIAIALFATQALGQPTPTFNDVIYATAPTDAGGTINLPMDIYKPTNVSNPTPVVIWIHGGGWQGGTHNSPPLAVQALLNRGVSVASVEYRLSGTSIFPAQINDVKGAVRYLRANASTYGLDMNRVAAWGTSAGGHLSALLATSGDVASLEGTTGGNLGFSSRIFSAVDYFGPSDLLNMNPDVTNPPGSTLDHDSPNSPESHLIGFDGPGEGIGVLRANQNNPNPPYPQLMALITSTSPIAHVSPDDPAIFIAHGLNDTTVPSKQSQRLFNAMSAASLNTSLTLVPGAGHGALGTAVEQASIDFLASQLLPVSLMANWNNPFGGTFNTPTNWHQSLAPAPTENLIFNFDASYAVDVNNGTTARDMTIGRGKVQFNLASTFELTGTLNIARSTGPRASLIINGGTFAADRAFVGGTSTAVLGNGSLVLDNDAFVYIDFILSCYAGSTVELRAGSDSFLRVRNLSNTGTIDLNDNAMLLASTSTAALATIEQEIREARNGGTWDQTGITSSTARNDATHSHTVGAILGSQFLSTGTSLFHGIAVSANNVLIQYTLYGDTDFNGVVNFDDYARTDNGFNNGLSGWFNGDFDLNGVVNFDDYALIDLAFNAQPSLQSVPEPTATLGLIGTLAAILFRRRSPI